MKLIGKAYYWEKDSHIDCRSWFVLKDLFRTLYAPHLRYSSETNYKESNVEYEPELEKSQLINLVAECREILVNTGKLLKSMAVKIDIDSVAPILIEPEVVEEPEPEVVEDPEL